MDSPIAQLREIEAKSLARRELVLHASEESGEWRGIVFKLGEKELTTHMPSVVEVLNPMECTRVPASQPWFKGIANIRGQLVPISDLHSFLYGTTRDKEPDPRVIVFRLANTVAGLEVSGVSGIRNFKQDNMDESYPEEDEHLKPVITGCFHDDGENYPVFDFNRLISNERFMQITSVNEG